jgi:hypothetical protein
MNAYKTFYVVIYNNNNSFVVAPKSLESAFDKFLQSNPTEEINTDYTNNVEKSKHSKPITYTFKKHYRNQHNKTGLWYEFKSSNSGLQPWYEKDMDSTTWYEIQPVHFYLNKSHKHRHSTKINKNTTSKYKRSSSHKKTAKNAPTIVVQSNTGGWWSATPDQQKAYEIFLKDPNDPPGIIQIFINKTEYFNFKNMNSGQSIRWHEIQDRTKPHKWRRIQYATY